MDRFVFHVLPSSLDPISSRYDHLDYLLLETRRISATGGRGAAALAIACPSHPAMPAMAMASQVKEEGDAAEDLEDLSSSGPKC